MCLLDAVVHDDELRALLLVEEEHAERVAVERGEKEVADADEELDDLCLGVARRLGGRLVVLDEEGADEAAAEVAERQALRLYRVLHLAQADDEVDERQIRVPPVDRERGDARAHDDREGEEALADDLAQGLKGPDALPDALEPAIGADGVELELALSGRGQGPLLYQTAFLGPMNAHGLHAATRAPAGVAPRRAALQHAHVAKREVVAHGVRRVEAREGRGDLLGRAKGGGGAAREAEVPGQPVDVDVDGDEQTGRVDVPQAEVHAVGGADHPAQE